MAEPGTPEGPRGRPTLGLMLQERREARGLSREQAAEQSRVQLVFVRALEEDDYRLLPDGMYLGRFVWEYARFLGIDPEVAVATFRRQVRRQGEVTPLARSIPRLATVPWRQIGWATGALLAVLPLAFIILSLVGKEGPGPPPDGPREGDRSLGTAPGMPPETGGERGVPAEPRERSGSSPEQSVTFREPAAIPPPGGRGGDDLGRTKRHVLVVRARELTWLAVQADGKESQETLLREGETVRWEADQGFTLTLGNAGGLDMTFDGRPVRPPGERGEVVRGFRLQGSTGGSGGNALHQPQERTAIRKRDTPSPLPVGTVQGFRPPHK
jgi:cytoskeleton protein RodZ